MSNHIPYQPAPGMHGLMPGWVKMPVLVNPITYIPPSSGAAGPSGNPGSIAIDSGGNLVPTFGAGQVAPHLGAFIAARFPVPQNPILDYLRKGDPGMSGCGCANGGGMGQLNFDPTAIMNGTAGGETYLVLGAVALGALWFFGGGGKSKYHAARGSRAEKKARVASAQAQYYRALQG